MEPTYKLGLLVVSLIFGSCLMTPFPAMGAQPSKEGAARSDMTTLSFVLHRFEQDCHRYPTTKEGLRALLVAPSSLEKTWRGPYLSKRVPNDPWARPYIYHSDRRSGFTIISPGTHGHSGAAGPSEDIVQRS